MRIYGLRGESHSPDAASSEQANERRREELAERQREDLVATAAAATQALKELDKLLARGPA